MDRELMLKILQSFCQLLVALRSPDLLTLLRFKGPLEGCQGWNQSHLGGVGGCGDKMMFHKVGSMAEKAHLLDPTS